jgi:hypothetical protein
VNGSSAPALDGLDLVRYPRQMSPAAPVERARAPLPPLLLIFAAWLVPALLSGFNTYMQNRLEGHAADWRWVCFNSTDWLLYARADALGISRQPPVAAAAAHLARNIALHIAGALAMSVAWAGLGTLLRLAIFPIPPGTTGPQDVLREFAAWVFTTLPFGVGVYFALVGIEHSLFYFSQARERETQAVRLAAQLAEARLGASHAAQSALPLQQPERHYGAGA